MIIKAGEREEFLTPWVRKLIGQKKEAGLKGRAVGGACVSKKHAGFIVNLGGATASDVKELINQIKAEIFNRYGIHIECEIVFAPSC